MSTISFQIFKLTLCSADDGLTEAQLLKAYKFDPEITDGDNYRVIKGTIHFVLISRNCFKSFFAFLSKAKLSRNQPKKYG